MHPRREKEANPVALPTSLLGPSPLVYGLRVTWVAIAHRHTRDMGGGRKKDVKVCKICENAARMCLEFARQIALGKHSHPVYP